MKECKVKDCKSKVIACNYCGCHYQRMRFNGTTDKTVKARVKKGSIFKCKICHNEFYRPPSAIKRGEIGFCSQKCASVFSRGRINKIKPLENRWKVDRKGYISTTIRRKRVWQHRHIMEQVIGRPLATNEIIHHLNGIKTDNRVENLHITDNKNHPLGYGHAFSEGYKVGYVDGLGGVTCKFK